MGIWRSATWVCVALTLASSVLAGTPPNRSGEPFLRSLLRKVGQSVHVRINREQRADQEASYTADHVSELWVDQEGRFRLEKTDMWGGGRLVVNDRKWLVTDDLEGGPVAAQPGWPGLGSPDELLGLFGSTLSAIHLLAIGDAAFDDLVAKDSDIVEERSANGHRILVFTSSRIGRVRLTVAPAGRNWNVVQADTDLDGTCTRDLVRTLPAGKKALFDTSFAKAPSLP